RAKAAAGAPRRRDTRRRISCLRVARALGGETEKPGRSAPRRELQGAQNAPKARASKSSLGAEGADAHEDDNALRVRAIDWVEERGRGVERSLGAERGREVGDEVEVVVVAEGVGLHAREKMLLKVRRQGILADEQQVRAIHVLDARPDV